MEGSGTPATLGRCGARWSCAHVRGACIGAWSAVSLTLGVNDDGASSLLALNDFLGRCIIGRRDARENTTKDFLEADQICSR